MVINNISNLTIQWGRKNNANLPVTISLPVAVTDELKTALTTNVMGTGSNTINSRNITTTTFDIYGNPTNNMSFSWIHISY